MSSIGDVEGFWEGFPIGMKIFFFTRERLSYTCSEKGILLRHTVTHSETHCSWEPTTWNLDQQIFVMMLLKIVQGGIFVAGISSCHFM